MKIKKLFQQLESHNALSDAFDMNDRYFIYVDFCRSGYTRIALRPYDPYFRSWREFLNFITFDYSNAFYKAVANAELTKSTLGIPVMGCSFELDGEIFSLAFVVEVEHE